MKKSNVIYKPKYASPKIEKIEIDTEISLQLDSTPPVGPGGGKNMHQYSPADPYKQNMA